MLRAALVQSGVHCLEPMAILMTYTKPSLAPGYDQRGYAQLNAGRDPTVVWQPREWRHRPMQLISHGSVYCIHPSVL